MIRQLLSSAVVLLTGVSMVCSQVVVLNSPSPWLSLRSDSINVKAQIDTAANKSKLVDYTVSSVIGGVTKVVAKKQVKITDVSNDVFVAKLNSSIIGGTDYLKIEWAADSQHSEIVPFGILALDKLPKTTPVKAVSIDSNATLKAVAESVKDDQFVKVGTRSFAVVWNSKALYYVVKKSADSLSLVFGFDGKNGKNAFVAYPDRFISVKKDSVWGMHYNREVANAQLSYTEIAWNNEITKEIVGDRIVVKMPWFDSGVVPFDGRQVGFTAIVKGKDKAVVAFPEKALQYIPGTWGNLVLAK